MSHPSFALSALNDYVEWTATIWSGSTILDVRDYAVMSLGVPGECAEVAELVLSERWDAVALCKELGDVLYYWARLCGARNIDVAVAWCEPSSASAPDNQAMALELCLAAGQVAECMKKYVRGDLAAPSTVSDARLVASLRRLAAAWGQIAKAAGLETQEVINANVAKLHDRRDRNVLKGSGDDR